MAGEEPHEDARQEAPIQKSPQEEEPRISTLQESGDDVANPPCRLEMKD